MLDVKEMSAELLTHLVRLAGMGDRVTVDGADLRRMAGMAAAVDLAIQGIKPPPEVKPTPAVKAK